MVIVCTDRTTNVKQQKCSSDEAVLEVNFGVNVSFIYFIRSNLVCF